MGLEGASSNNSGSVIAVCKARYGKQGLRQQTIVAQTLALFMHTKVIDSQPQRPENAPAKPRQLWHRGTHEADYNYN